MKKIILNLTLLSVMLVVASVAFGQPPGGGGGPGGGPPPGGGGAPIDGGATLFLGAVAAYAYKKLKGKKE